MTVTVYYHSLSARGMSMTVSSRFLYQKSFNSLDEAYYWINTTPEPIYNVSIHIKEEKDDKNIQENYSNT